MRGVRADAATRKAELIDRFELDPTKRGRSYSKGNRQKVALVAALAADVELLILDEPTAGLDPLIPGVVTQAGLLVAALLLWFSPIYRQQETAPVVVSVTLCGLIIAQIAATSVLHQRA